VRIVGLGDSTTAGTPGFISPLESPPGGRGNPESQYPYWMMKGHPDWQVLNRRINGQRSDQIFARFKRDVLNESPRYVIILAGVNDVYQERGEDFVQKNLEQMYTAALRATIKPVAATILPYNFMSEVQAAKIGSLNRWIWKRASILELLFCDTNWTVSNPANPNELSSSPDGLHPEVSGYRRMGEALTKTIENDLISREKG
jgi:lysophospholipase L1-like esterase